MELSNSKAWLVMVMIVLVAGFYWFSIRPEQARKECFSAWKYRGVNYQACLMEKGLK